MEILHDDQIALEFEVGNHFREVCTVDMNEPSGYKMEEEWTAFVRMKNPELNKLLYLVVH